MVIAFGLRLRKLVILLFALIWSIEILFLHTGDLTWIDFDSSESFLQLYAFGLLSLHFAEEEWFTLAKSI